MRPVRKLARNWVRRAWRGLREWCGDSAYERYVMTHNKRTTNGQRLMDEGEFYVEQLNRKYSQPNRCC